MWYESLFLYLINIQIMKNLFFTSILLFTSIVSYSQGYRLFKTQEYENIFATPESINAKAEIEKKISEYVTPAAVKKVTIPIVFHVLTDGKSGPDQNQIISQMQALKIHFNGKDFRDKHEAESKEKFKDKIADIELDFCLADIDPSGKKTSGINFITTSLVFSKTSNDMKFKSRGGADAWDTDKYLNIWVCNFPERIAGYAQMPGGDKRTDGIVIDYNFIGTTGTATEPYNSGKTLTHLIGNYLFLYDIWGPCYCCDDKVEDTPIHNGENFGKNNTYKEVTLCNGNAAEMTMNYMDNSDDEWMYMFTIGQKNRMQAVLSENGPRYGLTQGTNCGGQIAEGRSSNIIEMTLFPNPVRNTVEIEYPNNETSELSIEDRYGRSIYKASFFNKQSVDVSNWASGMYLVNIFSKNNIVTKNLIVIK
jgi:hypothetical protein